MAKKRTREEIIDDIYDYIKSDGDLASVLAEQLGCVNGDELWRDMDEFDSVLDGYSPSEIVSMTFHGGDISWEGEIRGEFNPNAEYFKFNDYGNLVSSDWANYSSYFTKEAVEDLANEHWWHLDLPKDLAEMFEELDELDEDE